MTITSMNDFLLKEMKKLNSNLSSINYDANTNTISYMSYSVSLNDFSLGEIYNDYSQLKSDIEVIEPKDLYNIIYLNVMIKEKDKANNIDENKDSDVIKKVSPNITNVNLITKKIEFGEEKQYVYITTSSNEQHILYDYAPKDVLEVFKDLVSKNNSNITEDELYEELKRKMQDLPLIDSLDAQTRNDVNDSFKNKISNMEKYGSAYANNDGSRVLGNSEHDIYIQNKQVVTFNSTDQGDIIREEHEGANLVDGSNNKDISQYNGFNEDGILEININSLIDVSNYIKMIDSPYELNAEDNKKVEFFEAFVSDLYVYKTYLGPTATSLWNEYEHYIIVTSTLEKLNNKQENAISNYNRMQTETKQVEFKNATNKALILEYQAEAAKKQNRIDNMAGVTNAVLIIEITSILSIIIATLVYFVAR